MTDKEWEEAKSRGKRKNAFAFAMSDCFEQLGENEQEQVIDSILESKKFGRVMARSSKPDAHNRK